jgi:hypothetical protein
VTVETAVTARKVGGANSGHSTAAPEC